MGGAGEGSGAEREFLLDPSWVFLNHGSFGACPRVVLERSFAWQRELERQPVAFFQIYNSEADLEVWATGIADTLRRKGGSRG